jgi:hypothetical protein
METIEIFTLCIACFVFVLVVLSVVFKELGKVRVAGGFTIFAAVFCFVFLIASANISGRKAVKKENTERQLLLEEKEQMINDELRLLNIEDRLKALESR